MQISPRRSAAPSAARRGWSATAGFVLLLALPGGAAAHANLVSSTPGPDEVLSTVPAAAVLTFSEALAEGSTFLILDSTGATIATGKPDPADPAVMSAALPSLSSGAYEVRWTSVGGDGDIERGSFSFTVALPNPTPGPTPAPSQPATNAPSEPSTPAPSPTGASAATPTPTVDGGGSGGGGGMDVLVPILAVVVLVGVGLALVLRRRGPA